MAEANDDNPSRSFLARICTRLRVPLIVMGVLLMVLLTFYTIEDYRGSRAWERCSQYLAKKGEKLDWNDFIPQRVPDDQNFFKATGMTAWFSWVASRTNAATNVLVCPPWITNPPLTLEQIRAFPEQSTVGGAGSRVELREWFAAHESEYQLLSNACTRPLAWLAAEYEQPWPSERADWFRVREVERALVTRANLNLADGKPAAAARDLRMLSRLAEAASYDRALVGAMIRVAMMGLYVEAARDGLEAGLWRDSELRELQSQIARVDLVIDVAEGLREMRAEYLWAMSRGETDIALQYVTGKAEPSLFDKLTWRFSPNGWRLQNQAIACLASQEQLEAIDVAGRRVYPGLLDAAWMRFDNKLQKTTPYNIWARHVVPNLNRAIQTMAEKQTLLDQLFLACALERYRLAHSDYPETLEPLSPDFLDHIPTDLFTGRPLQYRKESEGYIIWSTGWNEQDDGATFTTTHELGGGLETNELDWVWRHPGK